MSTFRCAHCGEEHPDGTLECPETGDDITVAMSRVGKVLDEKFEVLSLIGEGGMGAVYEARHVRIRQQVALKVLHPEYAEHGEVRKRFLREAQAAGEIAHENVVQMMDFGDDGKGTVWLAMEKLRGESLSERLKREGPMPVDRAVGIMIQVLDALSASHELGIWHRDMKPANIFLCQLAGRDDFVKILDFGIAKVADPADGEKLTSSGDMLGTAHYMAAEQIAGKLDVDHGIDIYACGVILYQMLAGTVPFNAPSLPGVLYKIVNESPKPLAEHREDLPPGLADVVMKAMSRERSARHDTARELSEALAPFAGWLAPVSSVRESAGSYGDGADDGTDAGDRSTGTGRSRVPTVPASNVVESRLETAPHARAAAPSGGPRPRVRKLAGMRLALLAGLPLVIILPAGAWLAWAAGQAMAGPAATETEEGQGDGAASGLVPGPVPAPAAVIPDVETDDAVGDAAVDVVDEVTDADVPDVPQDPVDDGDVADDLASDGMPGGPGGAAKPSKPSKPTKPKCDPRVNPKCKRLRDK